MGRIAIVDIDNTLWPFSDAFYRELQKDHPDFPPPERWTVYHIWEGHCSVTDFIAASHAIHCRQDDEDHLPYAESRDFLIALQEAGFHVVIASHRTPSTLGPTERWLARHGLSYDALHLSLDKTVLFPGADVVVDDSPLTLAKAVESGALGVGLSCPWNSAYPSNGFELFRTLPEILDHILKRSGEASSGPAGLEPSGQGGRDGRDEATGAVRLRDGR